MLKNLNLKVYYGAMVEMICVQRESGTHCYFNTEIYKPDIWFPCYLE